MQVILLGKTISYELFRQRQINYLTKKRRQLALQVGVFIAISHFQQERHLTDDYEEKERKGEDGNRISLNLYLKTTQNVLDS